MTLPAGKKKNKGFLLLEVMVSVAILSVGILLALHSFVISLRAIDSSEDYFKAGLLLEEKIYEAGNAERKKGSSAGALSGFDSAFSWRMDVVELEKEELDEVTLKILWDKRNAQYDLSIMTYFK
ncbi:MAG: prepilin-type N-terminal cleavage/methylation domain-containing protein [Candidatus Omnitrophica bacterium]|nr:prepilin-type N-terminal cleavage/methylation domain-containing protein [Candidatus Omnitrophota bacterium]